MKKNVVLNKDKNLKNIHDVDLYQYVNFDRTAKVTNIIYTQCGTRKEKVNIHDVSIICGGYVYKKNKRSTVILFKRDAPLLYNTINKNFECGNTYEFLTIHINEKVFVTPTTKYNSVDEICNSY